MTILCPDVSEFQAGSTAPDWAGIKTKNGGAGIIRVGYGTGHLDHMFVQNYTDMKKNKFSFIGLYHYLVAGQDAVAQADQFCKWVGPPSAVAPGTVFICDLEEGNGSQLSRANAWLAHIDKFYGLDVKPLNERSWLYSGQSFAVSSGLSPIFNSARHTWVASYKATEAGLLPHTLWQSTNGKVGANITNWPGCGKCDTSQHNGTLVTLSADAWPATITPPDPQFHGEYITAGMFNLADLCTKVLGVPTNTALRMTAVHYGSYEPILATYINDVMTGKKPFSAPVPKGARIWCD